MCIQGPDTHDRALLASSVRLYYPVPFTYSHWTILELHSLTQHRTAAGDTAIILRLTTGFFFINMVDLRGVRWYTVMGAKVEWQVTDLKAPVVACRWAGWHLNASLNAAAWWRVLGDALRHEAYSG